MIAVNILKTSFFACFILSNFYVHGKSVGELEENIQLFESKSQAVEETVEDGSVTVANAAPHAPRNVRVEEVTNTSVEVSWNEPPVSTGPVEGYRILWKNSSLEGEEDTRSVATSHTFKYLTPYVNYALRVLALTPAGPGEVSNEVTFRTAVGTPHAPSNVRVRKVTNTSVEVSWNEPSVSTGPVVGYRIRWRNSSLEWEEDTRSPETSHTFKYLTPYVNYTLRVLALTSAGPGEESNEVTFLTEVGTPHAPRNVRVRKVTNTSVEVSWNEPSVSTGPVVGYRIRWKNSSLVWEEDTRSAATSHTFKYLTPYVNYALRVLALTFAGPGEWSNEVTFRTAVGTNKDIRNCTQDMRNCEETGGYCIGARNGTIQCKCSENSTYEPKYGCRTNKDIRNCTQDMRNCEETGGYCIRARNGTIQCKCSENSTYEPKYGCRIAEVATDCSLYMRNCSETGGYCIRARDGTIQCKCPGNSTYEPMYGCRKFCRYTSCGNGGICRVDDGVENCYCKEPYGGRYCYIRMGTCLPNICRNAGLCRTILGKPECFCMQPFSGTFCETRIDQAKLTVSFAVACALAVLISSIVTSVICICCHRILNAKK